MNLLLQSAMAWKEMTEYSYLFTYGYKKKLFTINLTFSLDDYPHLAGFQYMKDLSLPNYTSAKLINRILEGKISFKNIQKATQYETLIKPRLKALIHLKESLDNPFVLLSYLPKMYPFYTNMKADYLISSHINFTSYIFIIQSNKSSPVESNYLCCSLFEKSERDYKTNQKTLTILKKERIHIPTNTSTILFNKLLDS